MKPDTGRLFKLIPVGHKVLTPDCLKSETMIDKVEQEIIMAEFGELLRKKREEKGITQKTLGGCGLCHKTGNITMGKWNKISGSAYCKETGRVLWLHD